MTAPNLMPYQDESFNGDHFIRDEFIKLRDRFNITTAVETGTCLGSTTIFLAQQFEKVYTVEVNDKFLFFARPKFLSHPNITSILGNSESVISELKLPDNTIFFLDAHGFGAKRCPLLAELNGIYKTGIKKPVITIHDFKTDNNQLGYDSYNDQPYVFSWIKHMVDKIYGVDNYSYYYNKEAAENSAKRGIIYILPNTK